MILGEYNNLRTTSGPAFNYMEITPFPDRFSVRGNVVAGATHYGVTVRDMDGIMVNSTGPVTAAMSNIAGGKFLLSCDGLQPGTDYQIRVLATDDASDITFD